MNLQQAQYIAVDLYYLLQPFCNKINIAGSIRRQKPEVKDIEIICLPMKVVGGQDSLFDEGTRFYMVNPDFVKTVNGLGKPIKGKPDGKYMQIELPQGVNLDLFMPDDFDYYRQYAIRTGSADYSGKVIAGGWRKKGWCGSDKGLRKIVDCIDHNGKWKCINPEAELPPVWESEQEFFEWLGIKWIKPKERNV